MTRIGHSKPHTILPSTKIGPTPGIKSMISLVMIWVSIDSSITVVELSHRSIILIHPILNFIKYKTSFALHQRIHDNNIFYSLILLQSLIKYGIK